MNTSGRQKKRIVAEGLRQLKSKAGWDPASYRSPSTEERLRTQMERTRTEACLADADQCAACQALRACGDSGALCEEHLRKAMMG